MKKSRMERTHKGWEILSQKKAKHLDKKPKYGLRSLSVGLVSCLLGFMVSFGTVSAVADGTAQPAPVHGTAGQDYAEALAKLDDLKKELKRYDWHLDVLSGDGRINEADLATLTEIRSAMEKLYGDLTASLHAFDVSEQAHIQKTLNEVKLPKLPELTTTPEQKKLPNPTTKGQTTFFGARDNMAGHFQNAKETNGGFSIEEYEPGSQWIYLDHIRITPQDSNGPREINDDTDYQITLFKLIDGHTQSKRFWLLRNGAYFIIPGTQHGEFANIKVNIPASANSEMGWGSLNYGDEIFVRYGGQTKNNDTDYAYQVVDANTKPLREVIAKESSVKQEEKYTNATYAKQKAYDDAIAKGKQLVARRDIQQPITQQEVTNAVNEINAAYNALDGLENNGLLQRFYDLLVQAEQKKADYLAKLKEADNGEFTTYESQELRNLSTPYMEVRGQLQALYAKNPSVYQNLYDRYSVIDKFSALDVQAFGAPQGDLYVFRDAPVATQIRFPAVFNVNMDYALTDTQGQTAMPNGITIERTNSYVAAGGTPSGYIKVAQGASWGFPTGTGENSKLVRKLHVYKSGNHTYNFESNAFTIRPIDVTYPNRITLSPRMDEDMMKVAIMDAINYTGYDPTKYNIEEKVLNTYIDTEQSSTIVNVQVKNTITGETMKIPITVDFDESYLNDYFEKAEKAKQTLEAKVAELSGGTVTRDQYEQAKALAKAYEDARNALKKQLDQLGTPWSEENQTRFNKLTDVVYPPMMQNPGTVYVFENDTAGSTITFPQETYGEGWTVQLVGENDTTAQMPNGMAFIDNATKLNVPANTQFGFTAPTDVNSSIRRRVAFGKQQGNETKWFTTSAFDIRPVVMNQNPKVEQLAGTPITSAQIISALGIQTSDPEFNKRIRFEIDEIPTTGQNVNVPVTITLPSGQTKAVNVPISYTENVVPNLLIKASEARKAAQTAIQNAATSGTISDATVEEINRLNEAFKQAKEEAKAAIEKLAEGEVKTNYQNQLNALTDLIVPPVITTPPTVYVFTNQAEDSTVTLDGLKAAQGFTEQIATATDARYASPITGVTLNATDGQDLTLTFAAHQNYGITAGVDESSKVTRRIGYLKEGYTNENTNQNTNPQFAFGTAQFDLRPIQLTANPLVKDNGQAPTAEEIQNSVQVQFYAQNGQPTADSIVVERTITPNTVPTEGRNNEVTVTLKTKWGQVGKQTVVVDIVPQKTDLQALVNAADAERAKMEYQLATPEQEAAYDHAINTAKTELAKNWTDDKTITQANVDAWKKAIEDAKAKLQGSSNIKDLLKDAMDKRAELTKAIQALGADAVITQEEINTSVNDKKAAYEQAKQAALDAWNKLTQDQQNAIKNDQITVNTGATNPPAGDSQVTLENAVQTLQKAMIEPPILDIQADHNYYLFLENDKETMVNLPVRAVGDKWQAYLKDVQDEGQDQEKNIQGTSFIDEMSKLLIPAGTTMTGGNGFTSQDVNDENKLERKLVLKWNDNGDTQTFTSKKFNLRPVKTSVDNTKLQKEAEQEVTADEITAKVTVDIASKENLEGGAQSTEYTKAVVGGTTAIETLNNTRGRDVKVPVTITMKDGATKTVEVTVDFVPDKKALTELVNGKDTIKAGNSYVTSDQAQKQAYDEAIQKAEELNNKDFKTDTSVTQKQVDDAVRAVEDAITALGNPDLDAYLKSAREAENKYKAKLEELMPNGQVKENGAITAANVQELTELKQALDDILRLLGSQVDVSKLDETAKKYYGKALEQLKNNTPAVPPEIPNIGTLYVFETFGEDSQVNISDQLKAQGWQVSIVEATTDASGQPDGVSFTKAGVDATQNQNNMLYIDANKGFTFPRTDIVESNKIERRLLFEKEQTTYHSAVFTIRPVKVAKDTDKIVMQSGGSLDDNQIKAKVHAYAYQPNVSGVQLFQATFGVRNSVTTNPLPTSGRDQTVTVALQNIQTNQLQNVNIKADFLPSLDALKQAVVEAEKAKTTIDYTDATQEQKQAFDDALQKAQEYTAEKVAQDTSITQQTLDDAKQKLQEAIAGLEGQDVLDKAKADAKAEIETKLQEKLTSIDSADTKGTPAEKDLAKAEAQRLANEATKAIDAAQTVENVNQEKTKGIENINGVQVKHDETVDQLAKAKEDAVAAIEAELAKKKQELTGSTTGTAQERAEAVKEAEQAAQKAKDAINQAETTAQVEDAKTKGIAAIQGVQIATGAEALAKAKADALQVIEDALTKKKQEINASGASEQAKQEALAKAEQAAQTARAEVNGAITASEATAAGVKGAGAIGAIHVVTGAEELANAKQQAIAAIDKALQDKIAEIEGADASAEAKKIAIAKAKEVANDAKAKVNAAQTVETATQAGQDGVTAIQGVTVVTNAQELEKAKADAKKKIEDALNDKIADIDASDASNEQKNAAKEQAKQVAETAKGKVDEATDVPGAIKAGNDGAQSVADVNVPAGEGELSQAKKAAKDKIDEALKNKIAAINASNASEVAKNQAIEQAKNAAKAGKAEVNKATTADQARQAGETGVNNVNAVQVPSGDQEVADAKQSATAEIDKVLDAKKQAIGQSDASQTAKDKAIAEATAAADAAKQAIQNAQTVVDVNIAKQDGIDAINKVAVPNAQGDLASAKAEANAKIDKALADKIAQIEASGASEKTIYHAVENAKTIAHEEKNKVVAATTVDGATAAGTAGADRINALPVPSAEQDLANAKSEANEQIDEALNNKKAEIEKSDASDEAKRQATEQAEKAANDAKQAVNDATTVKDATQAGQDGANSVASVPVPSKAAELTRAKAEASAQIEQALADKIDAIRKSGASEDAQNAAIEKAREVAKAEKAKVQATDSVEAAKAAGEAGKKAVEAVEVPSAEAELQKAKEDAKTVIDNALTEKNKEIDAGGATEQEKAEAKQKAQQAADEAKAKVDTATTPTEAETFGNEGAANVGKVEVPTAKDELGNAKTEAKKQINDALTQKLEDINNSTASEDAKNKARAEAIRVATEEKAKVDAAQNAEEATNAGTAGAQAVNNVKVPTAESELQDAKQKAEDVVNKALDDKKKEIEASDASAESKQQALDEANQAAEDAKQAIDNATTPADANKAGQDGAVNIDNVDVPTAEGELTTAKEKATAAIDKALQDKIKQIQESDVSEEEKQQAIRDVTAIANAEKAKVEKTTTAADAIQAGKDAVDKINHFAVPSQDAKQQVIAENAVADAQKAVDKLKDKIAELGPVFTQAEKEQIDDLRNKAEQAIQNAKDEIAKLKDSDKKTELTNEVNNIQMPPKVSVNDANEDGVIDSQAEQAIADAKKAVDDVEKAIAEKGPAFSEEDKKAIDDLRDKAQQALDNAKAEVDKLEDGEKKTQLQDELGSITIPGSVTVNDHNKDGKVDTPEENQKFEDAIQKTDEAQKAADAVKDAIEKAGDAVTEEEKAKIDELIDAAEQAKKDAEDAIKQLPDGDTKKELQDKVAGITIPTSPEVNDMDGDGQVDDVRSDAEEAKKLVTLAENAAKRVEEKIAELKGVVTPEDKQNIDRWIARAEEAKKKAQEAVDALPYTDGDRQELQNRLDNIQIPASPKVNDRNGNGVVDRDEPRDPAKDLEDAKKKVEEAQKAADAVKEAIKEAGNAVSPEEKEKIDQLIDDAKKAKDEAEGAIDVLPDGEDKKNLENTLGDITIPEAPTVNDYDGDGKVGSAGNSDNTIYGPSENQPEGGNGGNTGGTGNGGNAGAGNGGNAGAGNGGNAGAGNGGNAGAGNGGNAGAGNGGNAGAGNGGNAGAGNGGNAGAGNGGNAGAGNGGNAGAGNGGNAGAGNGGNAGTANGGNTVNKGNGNHKGDTTHAGNKRPGGKHQTGKSNTPKTSDPMNLAAAIGSLFASMGGLFLMNKRKKKDDDAEG